MSSQTDIVVSCNALALTIELQKDHVIFFIPGYNQQIVEVNLPSIAAFNLFVETMKDAQRAINNQVDRPTPSQASPRLSDLITPHSGDSDPDGEHPHLRMEDC